MSADPIELAGRLAMLLGGDLGGDLAVERETVDEAVEVALRAALAAIPTAVVVSNGVRLPVAQIADSFLRPLVLRGIEALLDAAYPKRVELHAEGDAVVAMTIHDE